MQQREAIRRAADIGASPDLNVRLADSACQRWASSVRAFSGRCWKGSKSQHGKCRKMELQAPKPGRRSRVQK